MLSFFKKSVIRFVGLGLSLALSSCQFGFMSVENEKGPSKQAVNFSSDPELIPSRLVLSLEYLKLKNKLRLTICEPAELMVANAKSMEVPLKDRIKVELSSIGIAGKFFFDKACLTEVTSSNPLYIDQGKSHLPIYYKATSYNYSNGAINRARIEAKSDLFTSQPAEAEVIRVVTQLGIDNPPQNTNVGICSTSFKITSLDGLGNPYRITSVSDSNVTLTSGLIQPAFYGNPNCTGTPSLKISKGESATANLYFKVINPSVLASGDKTILQTSFSGDTAEGNLVKSVSVDSPLVHKATELVFVTAPPSSLNVGVCSSAFTITSRDGLGNAFSENNKAVNLSSASAGSFYSSLANCNNNVSISSATLTSAAPSTQLYFKVTSISISSAVLTGGGTGVTDASALVQITRTATALTFDAPPSSLNVGECSTAFTITSRDGLGNTFSENNKAVNLSSASAGSFYATLANCNGNTSPITSTSLTTAAPRAQLYFKVTSISISSAVLTGSFTGVTSASALVQVTRTATALTFDASPSSLNVGVCSSAFTITSRDGLGNTFSENNKAVNLSSASAGSFYDSSGCTSTPINSIFLSANNPSSEQLFFKVTSLSVASVSLTATFASLSKTQGPISVFRLQKDITFGSDGTFTPDIEGNVLALARYQDGYVIAGFSMDNSSPPVPRGYVRAVNSNGTLRGANFTELTGNSSRINSILVEGTDIYFVGTTDISGNADWLFGKLTLQNDIAWNIEYIRNIEAGNMNDSAIGIESISDSQIVIAGERFEVAVCEKLNGNCNDGVTSLSSPPDVIKAKKVIKDNSGNVLVAGSSNSHFAVMKFNPSLAPLNLSNPIEFFVATGGIANSIALDRNGKILLAGSSLSQLAIVRLNSDLSLDTTFGSPSTPGMVRDSISPEATDIIIESSGTSDNLLISGSSSNQMLVRRYQPNGSFNNPTINSKNISFSPDTSVANRIILDGFKIVLGGKTGNKTAVVRIHP